MTEKSQTVSLAIWTAGGTIQEHSLLVKQPATVWMATSPEGVIRGQSLSTCLFQATLGTFLLWLPDHGQSLTAGKAGRAGFSPGKLNGWFGQAVLNHCYSSGTDQHPSLFPTCNKLISRLIK